MKGQANLSRQGRGHVKIKEDAAAKSYFRQNNIDLMVLGTHGKVGTAGFWSGSITPRICARCKIPLLLVPVSQTL